MSLIVRSITGTYSVVKFGVYSAIVFYSAPLINVGITCVVIYAGCTAWTVLSFTCDIYKYWCPGPAVEHKFGTDDDYEIIELDEKSDSTKQ